MSSIKLGSTGGGSVILRPASTGADINVTVPAIDGELTAAATLAAARGSSLVGFTPYGTNAPSTTAENALRVHDTHLLTQAQQHKVSLFLKDVKTKPCRVLLTATSIGHADNSAIQVLCSQLKAKYGENSSQIIFPGIYGGTFGPSGGYAKQIYGGSYYNRMAMTVGNADYSNSGYVDSINLIYGKESDGGSFDVYIDGVYDATLTSNGTQSYNNVYTKTFTTRGYHTITVKAPTSGYAYLERVELLVNDPGIFIENATMGGFGLHDTTDFHVRNSSLTSGNKAAIQLVDANTGIDSWFGRTNTTKPDLIICQQFTNDTGTVSMFSTYLARAVADAKTTNVPLVLCTEMPAMSFVAADGTLTAVPSSIRNTILSYRNDRNVAVIDWTEMVDYSNRTAYEAKYFPGSDKTHPNNEGQSLMLTPLCGLFNVEHPGYYSSWSVDRDQPKTYGSIVNPQASNTLRFNQPGQITYRSTNGISSKLLPVMARAKNVFAVNVSAPVHYSADVPNLVPKSDVDYIVNSSTSNQYGPYVDLGISTWLADVFPHTATSIEQEYTVVILAQRLTGNNSDLRFNHPGSNNLKPRIYLNGTNLGPTELVQINLISPTYPELYYFTYRNNSDAHEGFNAAMQISGSKLRVYGVWAAEGSVPVIPMRNISTYAGIGVTLPMVGDETIDRVTVGQAYLESINSTTIEKRALDGFVWKPLSSTYNRIYEFLSTKTSSNYIRIPVITPGTLTWNQLYNGYVSTSGAPGSGGNSWGIHGAFPSASFPSTKKFTLAFRSVGPRVGYKIYFFNGGNNNMTYLKADGTWGVTPDTLSLTSANVNSRNGGNIAFTFNMPDTATFGSALGSSPAFYIVPVPGDGTALYAPAVLVEGSSACV